MDKKNIEYVGKLNLTQMGILFQEKHKSNTYVESFALELAEDIDLPQIERALDKLELGHSVLRSIIVSENVSVPLVVYLKTNKIPLSTVFMGEGEDINDILIREKNAGIDISVNALRGVVCQKDGKIRYIIFVSHHIFIDGWSSSMIFRDFSKSLKGERLAPERPFYTYADKRDPDLYDLDEYRDYQGKMFVPGMYENVRSDLESECELGSDLSLRTEEYCKKNKITKAVFFAAAFSVLMSSYNDMRVDLGFVVSGRNNIEYLNTIGLFIKTIPFSVNTRGRSLSALYSNLESKIEKAESGRLPTTAELTDLGFSDCNTLFVMENYPDEIDNDSVCKMAGYSENTHYDLVLQVLDKKDKVFHLLTNKAGRDLKVVSGEFIRIIEKMLDVSVESDVSLLVSSKSISMDIVAPFEAYYLDEKLKASFAAFDLNLNVSTYDNQEIGLITEKKISRLVIIYAPYLLAYSGTTPEAFELYFNGLKRLIEGSSCDRLLLVDMSAFKFGSATVTDEVVSERTVSLLELVKSNSADILNVKDLDSGNIWNASLYYNANIPFEESFFSSLQQKIAGHFLRNLCKPKKLLITDGDKTLWNGTIRNGGIGSIAVDDQKKRFQKNLKAARDKGFLLALCTRNDINDVKELFDTVSGFEIGMDDFVAVVANDCPKSENIRNICDSLVLGMESVVFFDDSSYECAEVMRNLPDALVIPAMGDNTDLVFERLFCLDSSDVSEEDRKRNEVYTNEKIRKNEADGYSNIRDFWKSLNTELEFSIPSESDISRILQLSSRTNRFRNDLINIDKTEIEKRIASKEAYVIRAKDRFGSYGLIAFISWIPAANGKVVIDHWYMSCRLSVEYAEYVILNYLMDTFSEFGYNSVSLAYEKTEKNHRFQGFIGNVAKSFDACDRLGINWRYEEYSDIPVKCVLVENSVAEVIAEPVVSVVTAASENSDSREFLFPEELYDQDLIGASIRYWNFLMTGTKHEYSGHWKPEIR